MNQQYKKYRNLLSRVIKSAKKNFYTTQFLSAKGDTKSTWKYINAMLGKSHSPPNESFFDKIEENYE